MKLRLPFATELLPALLMVLLCGLIAPEALAAEYFITNRPGSGTGTQSDPFGLVDLPQPQDMYAEGAALSALQPGDTLTFLPGVYELHTSSNTVFGYIRPARSGTAEKPITFRAQPGVVLRSVSGTQGVLGTVKLRGWVNLDYIRFHGFVVECRLPFDPKANPELNGMRLQGSHNEVGWCKFIGHYLPTRNNYDGIRVENAVEARVHHNEIRDWQGDHWNANGIKVYCSDRCVFEDNYIHDNHTGIFEKDSAAGNIYRRNYVTGNKAVAFLGSNQTRRDRSDAWYSVYENVFAGPVNLLTLSRGIEFHDNLLLGPSTDPDHKGYALYASGGKVYQLKLWNNVCLTTNAQIVAYGLDQTRWDSPSSNNPLEYCDYNVYQGTPTYRFGRYTGKEDVFTLEQMHSLEFERNAKMVTKATDLYEDQTSYKLRPQWLRAGRNGDPVGPDDVATILDTTRYGPSARLAMEPASLWPTNKAWEWYRSRTWLVGCNFLPSSAVNDIEMWEADTFDPTTIDRELGWAQNLGFNTVRVFLNFVVWKADPAGFKRRFTQFLEIADKHHLSVMPILFDDCNFADRVAASGKQPPPIPGVHNSQWVSSPPLAMITDRNAWLALEQYTKDMMSVFGSDRRVVVWDLYNEPGNSGMGAKSLPLVEAAFAWARSTKPHQPLTVGVWEDFTSPMSRRMMELSDVVSFHGYDPRPGILAKLETCRKYGRPMLCTEWLHRQGGNTVENILPVFQAQKVGCYNWGLVYGRTQTYMPWGSKPGTPVPALWQHDLLHPDGTPFQPAEVELIHRQIGLPQPESGRNAELARPFRDRGYYLCFMRMPTFGLAAWRQILDAVAADGGNTVILWMGGAFCSKKFPITWQWAKDHENVKADFGRELIAHAHQRGIKILLGFTPFGYDGVNQLPLEKPELKAKAADGKPVSQFGIGCWGWNLCPAEAASQNFMREYVREMAFEFYPEADGLFIESSDYAICHCPKCGPKFFQHEFAFVKAISDEMWARKPDATVVVYPHYFSGAKLRFSFAEATAAKEPFDPRWTLFFTPHSAPLEPALIARARGAWWWNEAPSRFDIAGIRAGARKAREARCTGYIPSLECYSYVTTQPESGEPWLVGRRQVPFGFGWLNTGANPYGELPVRAIRLAYRELSANPDLPDSELRARLGRELFGADGQPAQMDDLFALFEVFNTDRDWSVPGALTTPGLVRDRADHGRLDAKKRSLLRDQLARVQAIAARHRDSANPGAKELQHIAQWIADQWTAENAKILELQ